MRFCAQCRLPLDVRKWQVWRCVGCGPLVGPEEQWWLVADAGGNYWRAYCGDCRAEEAEFSVRELRARNRALVEALHRIRDDIDAAIWETD